MKRRVVRLAVLGTVVAVVLFALPLAVALRTVIVGRHVSDLQVAASEAAMTVGLGFPADVPEMPAAPPGGASAAYDRGGAKVSGSGPGTADAATLAALRGSPAQDESEDLVVAVPVFGGERVIGAVRVSEPWVDVYRQVGAAWGVEAGVAVLASVAGWLVARRLAGRLMQPLDDLVATAGAVGRGDLAARTTPSGIPELDTVARAQDQMVRRLSEALDWERKFNEHVSHQLRTPLAGLTLALGSAADGELGTGRLVEIRNHVARLERTIDDLLAIGPAPVDGSQGGLVEIESVLSQVEDGWHGPVAADGRRLVVAVDPGLGPCRVAPGPLTQILDVLLDNAVRHGRGSVSVRTHSVGDFVVLAVADEGTVPEDADPFAAHERRNGPHGIGLALAGTMASHLGGRLVLSTRSPTTFSLIVPTTPTDASPEDAEDGEIP